MSIEAQLREALSARADEIGGPLDAAGSLGDPYARVSGAIAADRRRRRTVALAGVAAVAAIAVAIPTLAGGLGRDTTTPAKRTTVVVPGPNDPRWTSMSTWPTRGSLADDRDFLDAFRETTTGTVLYAGDIETDRVVVAWSRDEEGTETVTVYADDRHTPAGELHSIASAGQGDTSAVVVRRDVSPDGWMLILAPPTEKSAQISPTVDLRLDGTVRRAWRSVALRDGAAVVDLQDAPIQLNRVRVGDHDSGSFLPARPSPVNATEGGFCGNCTGQDFLDHAEAGTRDEVANTFGLNPGTITTTTTVNAEIDQGVLAVSPLGDSGAKGATGHVYVGLTRLPGGQVVRTVQLTVSDASGDAAIMSPETAVPLDATTADRRPYVLWGTTPDSKITRYQVFAPDAARVQLVSDVPSLFPDSPAVRVANGSAVLATTPVTQVVSPYRVSTFDTSGALIGSWPLDLPNRNDPYDLQP